jgi:hypothetical protein
VIAPLLSQPPLVAGAEPRFGIGDILTSMFFSPAKPGAFIWGVGPALLLPATSDPFLGSGRWAAGPSVVVLSRAHSPTGRS